MINQGVFVVINTCPLLFFYNFNCCFLQNEIDFLLLHRYNCGEIWTACNHRKKC